MVLWSCSRDFSPIRPNNNLPPDGNKPAIIVGEPVKIVERGHSPEWTPDGQSLTYIDWASGSSNVFIAPSTGGQSTQLTVEHSYTMWTPSWSPDGKTLAFSNGTIFTVPAIGGKPIRIVPDSLSTQGCDWSPDGRHIVFDAHSIHTQGFNIWAISLVNYQVNRITIDSAYCGWPKYSPDGSKIAFEYGRATGNDSLLQVCTVSADGTDFKQISRKGGEFPCWSPDGKWLAFASNRGGDYDIYVMPSEGGKEIRITTSTRRELRPAWSPDGKMIAFDTNLYPSEPGIWVVTISTSK